MQIYHRYKLISQEIYFWLLVILAMALPFSPFLISFSQILLLINWIAEGNFQQKIKKFQFRKSLWVFLGIYAVHLIWLIGTSDWHFSEETLRIKLPMLILPIIIATSEQIDSRKIFLLLKLFIASVVAATIFSTIIYFGLTSYQIKDVRDISIFISHIRLSLLVVIAILTLLHWIKTSVLSLTKAQLVYILVIIWLICFLVLLKSLTGLIILLVTMFVLIAVFVNRIENQFLKVGLIIVLYTIPFVSAIMVVDAYNNYYNVKPLDTNKLNPFTSNGNPYIHDVDDWQIENGNKVWVYVCQKELKTEWNKRSKIKYDSLDLKKQPIYMTLIRYMTSKGLNKDSMGVTQLAAKDIINIEHGLGNVIYEKKWSLSSRLYEVIWELDHYLKNKAVDEHSVTQRFVYLKIATQLIKDNFFFGVGTGDLPKEYLNYYQTHDTGLSQEHWWHTHNQYFRLMATFGLVGFLVILFAFIYPAILERKWDSYYFVMIFTIIFLSFLNEDTLETQIGVTFATYFYALFLWGAGRRLY
jgi:hypothetical protein